LAAGEGEIDTSLGAAGKWLKIGPYGSQTTASGIRAGMWVCTEKEFNRVGSDYRRVYGRSAIALVPYQLVLATYPLDRQQQVVAFSDGTSVTWYQTKGVIITDCPEIETFRTPVDSDNIRGVAVALNEIIRVLDEHETAETLLNIFAAQGGRDPEIVVQALLTAFYWNLITVIEVPESPNDASSNTGSNSLVCLQPAGEDWYLTSSEFQPLQNKGRRSVGVDQGKQPSINIGTFAGILNFGKNISGQHTATVQHQQVADSEILSCLREVLAVRQIPWSDSDLADVRRVIEEALAQKNPRTPGLKPAIVKLRGLCGDVLVGMLSNGAYQLLLSFFGLH
jgi:hypothetical protein